MIADLVYEITATSGTGQFTLGGARSAEFRTFAAAHNVGDTVYYCCRGGGQWEVGQGTLTSATTLARTTVYNGSGGAGVAVNFAPGNKELYETLNSGSMLDLADAPASGTFADGDKVLVMKANGTLATILGSIIKAASGASQPTDTTAPSPSSAQVANATPTVIQITMSETLANSVPPASAFTVSGGKTASSVSISGAVVSVTVNSAYVNGNTITVSYTQPGANPRLQDAAGNAVASFSNYAVTNNVGAVVTVPGAPTIGTATAGDASASVSGTAPASNGGAAITGYRATSTPGGITSTSATLPVNVTGLTNGTAYTFTLAAQNSAGYGPESAASNSVTPVAAPANTYVLSNFTKGDSTPFPTTGTMTSAGTESYAETPILIRIKTAANAVPPNDAIKFVWGKSATVCPVADYNATSVPTNSGNGNTSTRTNSVTGAAKAGSWATSADAAFGNYRNAGTFYAWGTPGTWYLWVLTQDGFIGVAKDGNGNPATWTLS